MSKRELAAAARLRDPRERRLRRETLLEGPRLVGEAITAGVPLRQLFATEQDRFDRAGAIRAGGDIITVSPAGLERVATTTSPQGPVAIMPIPTVEPAAEGSSIVLVSLSDPGNVGTLIRSAACFGWNVICIGEGVDPWSPKVLRAAAGGHFRSPPETLPSFEPDLLRSRGYTIAAAVVTGGEDPQQLPPRRWALLLGHETRGLEPGTVIASDREVTIPMEVGSESLNAAVAGAILMYVMATSRTATSH